MPTGCRIHKYVEGGGIPHDIDLASGKVFKVGGTQVVGAQAATVAAPAAQTQTAVTVTYTANTPAAAANGALTIADGDTPTVAELLEYCRELHAQLVLVKADVAAVRTPEASMLTALKTHGLIASA